MANMGRREFLFAGVTAGLASREITRSAQAQPSQPTTDEILAADDTLDALLGSERIISSPPSANLPAPSTSPSIPYDRAMSRLLIRCSRLGIEQFAQGQSDRRYDGSIRALEGFSSELEQYTQVATFSVELDATTTLLPDLSQLGRRVAQRVIPPTPAFIGFVLASETNNIILFRGTSNPKEWMANFQLGQSNYSIHKLFVNKGVWGLRPQAGSQPLYPVQILQRIAVCAVARCARSCPYGFFAIV
ncbi:hypothetical protein [Leptolyngbya ohadii]|uniref:hypothetical protein n=1 Tax=Leptolyngbya ohadii TaxID=1962290 RepID=UPI00117A734B|nr:hypothetical protein [Leptolyngbya ohadii]